MLRKAAVLATAGALLLAANVAVAQGVTPTPVNPNPAMPAVGGAGNAAGGANAGAAAANQMAATNEFTGTIKAWSPQDKVLTMENGEKFFVRGNEPTNLADLARAGNRVKVTFMIDAAQQNEKVLNTITAEAGLAPGGGPAGVIGAGTPAGGAVR